MSTRLTRETPRFELPAIESDYIMIAQQRAHSPALSMLRWQQPLQGNQHLSPEAGVWPLVHVISPKPLCVLEISRCPDTNRLSDRQFELRIVVLQLPVPYRHRTSAMTAEPK